MFKKLSVAAFALISLSAFAHSEPVEIVSCFGDHHGSYVSVSQLGRGMSFISIHTDADESESPTRTFVIDSVSKNGDEAPPAHQTVWIRESVQEQINQTYEGVAIVRATNDKDEAIIMNINNRLNKSFLVTEKGYVEELTCIIAVK